MFVSVLSHILNISLQQLQFNGIIKVDKYEYLLIAHDLRFTTQNE